MKKNLVFTVAIVWQSNTNMKLGTSVYCAESDNVKNYDEALGRAISSQQKEIGNAEEYTMVMHNTSSSWTEEKKPDLSCLKYC